MLETLRKKKQYIHYYQQKCGLKEVYCKRKIIGVYKNGNNSGIINVGMCFAALNCNK